MIKLLKSETFLSILIAMGFFSILLLNYSSWESWQIRKQNLIYQQQQALQIIENQIALQMANINCETKINQNQINFYITCRENAVKVKFPLGEIEIPVWQ